MTVLALFCTLVKEIRVHCCDNGTEGKAVNLYISVCVAAHKSLLYSLCKLGFNCVCSEHLMQKLKVETATGCQFT